MGVASLRAALRVIHELTLGLAFFTHLACKDVQELPVGEARSVLSLNDGALDQDADKTDN
ncbi:MAG: hypothetical protein V1897_07175 [Pseudomonadota bacterium]